MVTYANLTTLLANMHIDSSYLVVVKKDGSVENESENGIFGIDGAGHAPSKHIHTVMFYVINPRRACTARVTVVVLRESWGAFFSMKGGKGGERGGGREEGQSASWGAFFSMKGGKGRGSKCKLRREIQTS